MAAAFVGALLRSCESLRRVTLQRSVAPIEISENFYILLPGGRIRNALAVGVVDRPKMMVSFISWSNLDSRITH